jgi:glycosyltransferase involved in cell wall biosynthesis
VCYGPGHVSRSRAPRRGPSASAGSGQYARSGPRGRCRGSGGPAGRVRAVSLRHAIRLAARSVVRHPRATWRRVSGQKLKALVRLLAAAPARLRRPVAGLVDRAADRLLRRDPGHGTGAPLRVVAWGLAGRRADALAFAERLGTDRAVTPRTALRLARAALALDGVDSAASILRALEARGAADDRPALAARADIALRTGRYAAAADLARRSGRATAIRVRAESELRALEPSWLPTIPGPPAGPLAGQPGRILHLLTNSLPYRQAGYTVRAQSIGLAQREVGLDPHFATRAGFPLNEGVLGVPAQESIDGVPYHRLEPGLDPAFGPDRVAEASALAGAELVERLRPSVLHPASNYLNAKVALALRERFGIPVVYEVRGFLEETWASRRPGDDERAAADRYTGAKAAETAAMLAADAVVTLSQTMKADIVARGVAADRVDVVPNAVDLSRFVPIARDGALAGRLGIRDGEVVLGYVSSFTGYEGIRYLIEATAILRGRGRPVRLLLVGDGEDRQFLEAEARRHRVDDGTVLFTGRVPHGEVQALYSVIDVFVVPRTADRVSQLVTPLKPYEAMALERAVVVSGVDALREIVRDGETGLVFEAESAVDLARVVEPLLTDPERRLALGRAAREWVAANRTWRQNGERYRALYARLGAV